MPQFNVTDLDYDQIKTNMIEYFSSLGGAYNDWNFEGAGLSQLMTILAYNTHYNAMIAQLSLNEVFLNSAQLRGNVVSAAKTLGYTPRSLKASSAVVNITVTASGTPPAYLDLQRGTRFTASTNSEQYTFVVLDTQEAANQSNSYSFNNVKITQGILKRMLYVVDPTVIRQMYVIPDMNVDMTTVRVRVKANTQSDSYTIFTPFVTLSGIGSSSQIYFSQENNQGQYELYFGDGIIGKALEANNIVEIEYIYTDGTIANGASAFTAVDTIGGYNTISVNVVSSSTGGAVGESIESIRFNAPLSYITQNRAVTADDYRSLILAGVGNIQSISVWGGEDSVIPDYGKVYICIKPTGAAALTTAEKNNITSNILKGKNVVSITPIIVDPDYTYITLQVFFKYNPNLTDLSLIDLQSVVRNTITRYNNDKLESFQGVFRYSEFLRAIDSSDSSIINSDAIVKMYKTVTPLNTVNNTFNIQYSASIMISNTTDSLIVSSPFLINGVTCYFGDSPIDNSIDRTVFVYKLVNGKPVILYNVGNIDSANGIINISSFRPDATTPIQITVPSSSNDLAPKRNQLLEIDLTQTIIIGSIDTIAVSGSAGAINYQTPATNI